MTPSPLGPYAALVAALVAVLLIGGYVVATLLPGVAPAAADRLAPLAILAVGAVLGSAVAVNGYKGPLTAAHSRLDKLQAAVNATAARATDPTTAPIVAAILEDHRPSDAPPAAGGPPAPTG